MTEISLVEVCRKISERYEICFIEIGADENHVNFFDPKCRIKDFC